MNSLYARSVFFVDDAQRALRFCVEQLGFAMDWNHEEEGRTEECQVSRGIQTKRLEWGRPTLVMKDMDANELFFWMPHDDWAALGMSVLDLPKPPKPRPPEPREPAPLPRPPKPPQPPEPWG
jgi:hypothetical protein